MSYQYFNIVSKKSLLLNGPKKGEAYTVSHRLALSGVEGQINC